MKSLPFSFSPRRFRVRNSALVGGALIAALVAGALQPTAAWAGDSKPELSVGKPVPGDGADTIAARKAAGSSASMPVMQVKTPTGEFNAGTPSGSAPDVVVSPSTIDDIDGAAVGGRWQKLGDSGIQVAPAQTGDGERRNPNATAKDAKKPTKPRAVGAVKAKILDQASVKKRGLRGLVLELSRTDGSKDTAPVAVRVPKKLLASLYGADFASRMRWMQISDTKADAKDAFSEGAIVPSSVGALADSVVVTPKIGANPTMLFAAAIAVAPSGTGDFTATSLKPSQAWDVSAATGTFSWAYPLNVPPAPAGPAPDLSLSYDSQSVDGLTGSTNNQPSAIGEGWSLGGSGFIERSYTGCAVDDGASGPVKTSGDLCWKTDNATISFAGHSGQLIRDTTTGAWRLQNDDGTRFERLTGGVCVNDTNDKTCWRMTTTDGTQYYFGMNQLPGYTSGKATTNSAWTVPVFGNDAGEPCHAATFAASSCMQGWRWNLDYVVDTHGNAEAFYYNAQTNMYSKNGTTATKYTRGGELNRIEYGLTASTVYATNAASGKVVFGYDANGRCSDSTKCTAQPVSDYAVKPTTPAAYPDIPFDQLCTSGTCAGLLSPTFWTTSSLTKVTTQALVSGAYANVDSWALGHSFPNPGDGTSAALWLTGVTHTGYAGSASLTEPSVTFTGVTMQNRVWAVDGLAPLDKYRISSIQTEMGAVTTVNYSAQECVPADRDPILAAPQSNTKRCFPQWWSPSVTPPQAPQKDLFHKYVVTSVVDSPSTGGAGAVALQKTYVYGKPGWRYNTSPLVPADKRTWSIFAGFDTAEVRVGNPSAPSAQNVTQYTFFQGLDGDRAAPAGGTKSVSVLGMTDAVWFAGQVRQTKVLKGVGGPVASTTLTVPWASSATSVDGTYTARYVRTSQSILTEPLSTGGNRTVTTTNTYDGTTGLIVTSTVAPSDARTTCTTTSYAASNTTAWIIGAVSRVSVAAAACSGVQSAGADAFISDTRTTYDAGSPGTAPTKGDATKVETVTGLDGTTRIWTATATNTYDARGRIASVKDALGRTTSTAYTPAAGTAGPLTATTVTNPLGWTTKVVVDAARGSLLSSTDQNGKVTTAAYDALGRRISVWLPSHPQSSNASSPSTRFTYTVSKTAASFVKTETWGPGSYQTSYALFDGLGRAVQSQKPASGDNGGSVITDTAYDDQGRTVMVNNPYWAQPNASGTLFVPTSQQQIPSKTETTYDALGRATKSSMISFGQLDRETATTYPGADRVDVTPPAGGTPTSTFTNSQGQKTKLSQYQAATVTGAGLDTTYEYTAQGKLSKMTDPAGNAWTWQYDARGNETVANDPDSGTITTTYDPVGNVLTSTDARGKTLAYSYDALDRKTGVFSGSTSGAQLAGWTFDALAKGQQDAAISFTGSTPGSPGLAYKQEVTGYNDLYEPLGVKYSIPAGAPAFAGTTYTVTNAYTDSGHLAQKLLPKIGGIANERLTYTYDGQANLVALQGLSYYAYNQYTPLAQLGLVSRGSSNELYTTMGYDALTGGVNNLIDTSQIGGTYTQQANRAYSFDKVGDVTGIKTTGAAGADSQCFTYDGLQNLSQAWTPAGDDCATAPSASGMGGAAPYWVSYSVDAATGNRTSATQNPVTAGGSAVVSTYSYPAAGSARPHAVQQVVSGSTTSVFGYDPSGNTVSRPSQVLSYDDAGRLSTVTVGQVSQSRVYDPSGGVLLQVDSKAGATLFLGETELNVPAGGATVSASRTYTVGDMPVAERVDGTVLLVAGDANRSMDLQMRESDGAITRRFTDPFGNTRGSAVTWATAHGYLNAPVSESTGLTQLGVRAYDPVLGRFLSVDPVLAPDNPKQNNGYGYSGNNPVTYSDPDGKCYEGSRDALNFKPNCSTGGGSKPVVTRDNPAGAGPDDGYYKGTGYNRYGADDDGGNRSVPPPPTARIGQPGNDGVIRGNTDALTYGNGNDFKFSQGQMVDWEGLLDASGAAADVVSVVWIGGSAWKIVRVAGKVASLIRLAESDPPLAVPNPLGGGNLPTGVRIGPPIPSKHGDGSIFPAGPTGPLSAEVAEVRIMKPGRSGGIDYPNGYMAYYNKTGQKINPITGRTIGRSDPFAHLDLGDR